MPDQERCAARSYTPASKLREEPCDAVGGGRASKPPSQTAPDTSRLRPAGAASCVQLPIEKAANVLFSQRPVCNV